MKPYISPHSAEHFKKPSEHRPTNPLPLIAAIAVAVFMLFMGAILG